MREKTYFVPTIAAVALSAAATLWWSQFESIDNVLDENWHFGLDGFHLYNSSASDYILDYTEKRVSDFSVVLDDYMKNFSAERLSSPMTQDEYEQYASDLKEYNQVSAELKEVLEQIERIRANGIPSEKENEEIVELARRASGLMWKASWVRW